MTKKGIDRRTFIKTAAGVGVGAAFAGSAYGMFRPISDVDVEVVPISYPGIKVMEGSPAPYGLPLIPLEITSSGDILGRPDVEEGQLRWYKYCSHERAPGTEPDFDSSNEIEYFVTQEKIAKGFDAWYKDYIGRTVNVADFPDEEPLTAFKQYAGVGAAFKWRSEGVDPEDTITGIIIRVKESNLPEGGIGFGTRIPQERRQQMLDTWIPQDPNDPDYRYVGFCSFCTHFCCVPGFHEADLAISSGFGETVFCTCHLSRYDAFTIETYDRTIFVFPNGEEEGGGGDHGGGGAH